ncbi:hypothetical protein F0L74_23710 [Chitinophaga agrisoli]|uniref:Uncharacterized protein n=1 Tax=Chitinophaga agrisoli TaxID=2607653 RepID=A0A5B2VL21_9BACT|nr:hypothetical protein [Chitinophaga agrisoli]KAA2239216.1 hypothetical protein F0L74_23710 [Chitinophaga agrisoli]
MALNNPDILYPLLDQLSQKVRYLNHRISYAIDDARRLVDVAVDQTNQATFETNYVANIKDEDAEKIDYWDNETTSMRNKLNRLLQGIEATHNRLNGIRRACNQSAQHWNKEHDIAVAWLRRAKNRLATAINNLNIAISSLQAAEARLNRAQSALSSCQNSYRTDSNGRRIYNDCSGHQREVANARHQVSIAQDEVRRWELEKREAEVEVAAAEARVRRCEEALSLIRQATDMNAVSINIILDADNFCRRGLEEVRSAGEIISRTKELNAQQDALVQENKAHLATAQNFSSDASTSFARASSLSADVQSYGSRAGEEIDRKVDLLKEFGFTPGNL